MVRSELITHIANKNSTMPYKDVELSVCAIIQNMVEALASGSRIEIRGFGSFSLKFHSARLARNPKTGEAVYTIPKYSAHFKPGRELRGRINAMQHIPLKVSKVTGKS